MNPQPMSAILAAVSTHLANHDLPQIVALHVGTGRCTLQLASRHPVPAALLAWAGTVTSLVVRAYRVPHETFVHLSLEGLIDPDVPVEVFGAIPYTLHGIGGHLAPGNSTIIPPDELRKAAEEDTQ